MRKRYFSRILMLSGIFILSCQTDYKYELPGVDAIPAILSVNDPDNEFQFRITMARPFTEGIIKMNPECKVDLYENDHFFTSLRLDTINHKHFLSNRYLFFGIDSGIVLSEGKEYKAQVDYPGFEVVTAKTIKPVPIKIKNVTWAPYYDEMPHWYFVSETQMPDLIYSVTAPLIELTITFNDPADVQNFYSIGISYLHTVKISATTDKTIGGRLSYASPDLTDPVFRRFTSGAWIYSKNRLSGEISYNYDIFYPKEILWNDIGFNGSENSIKLLVPKPSNITGYTTNTGFKYIIRLYSLSEDYYKYMVDRWLFTFTSSDPFAEPLRFHSNTSNGCGIFAFSSLDIDTIGLDNNY
jgi:hypothetical protein